MKATATLLVLASIALLAACDPFQTPGTWRSTGANDRNLQVMVADPRDLTKGVTTNLARGGAASTPVLNLLAGKRRKLESISTESSVGSASGGAGDAAAGQP